MQGLILVFIILLANAFPAAAFPSIKVFDRLQITLRQAGLKLTVNHFVTISLIAGLIAGLTVFLFSRSAPAAVVTAAIVTAAPSIFALDKRRRRFRALLEQLPGALELMIRSLQAGQSFVSALQAVATE